MVSWIACTLNIYAQEKPSSKINITSDFVSRYIWRGLDYGKAPSIQPTFSFIKSNFEIGSWGSFNTTGSYHELDLYAKYTIKGISVILTDYFVHNESNPNDTHYFDYDAKTTNHTFEGVLQYKGPEKFPLSILIGTYFYGNDRKITPDLIDSSKTTIKQNYSTYIELGYTVKCKEKTFDLFMGLTPQAGAYGNTFGVINAGITGYRTIKLTDKFELPVKASLIANPQAENLYFILGITI
jgi:hypothetical protein